MCMRSAGARMVLLLLLLPPRADAQQRALTLDDIYDPATRTNFSGSVPAGLTWIDATHFAWPKPTTDGVNWTSVDVSGREQAVFDPDRMQAALEAAGVPSSDARTASRARGLTFSSQYSAVIANVDNDLYAYRIDRNRVVRLTRGSEDEEHESFSPDGRRVAFIRNNNLYVVDVDSGRERPLTTDGTAKVLNAKLDWVYEEEIYGRGENRAYWWSPDSSNIAFLRLDDAPVPTFPVVDHVPYEQAVEEWNYPKAGDPNPGVTLNVVAVASGSPRAIDLERYAPADRLVIAVSWTPDSRKVVYEIQNRVQSFVDINVVDLASWSPRTLLHEQSQYWIDPDDAPSPMWLKDGSFVWLSARSGWKHLYHFGADGALLKQVTTGKWEFRTLHGIDEMRGWVYFSGTERSPIGRDVYRVRLDGTGFERLSQAAGTHSARFNPALTHYIDSWSDVRTPTQVRLHTSDGHEVRPIAENVVAALAQYKLAAPQFLQVATRDGFIMEAMMIKPPDFDPARRYPVYQFIYGGPHNQQVLNAWRGTDYLYHQLLAQHGVIVWVCDNRTASGKGAESEWPAYRNLGESEMRDVEDGVAWLRGQPYVDGSRIGIHGWSYGGFMTSYALTHSTSFVMGIAGGPVTDWRDYDTVYTERYMGLPKDNPAGYRKSAPRWFAGDLHGELLLIHGTIDDNVHLSNTIQFAYELQKAGKPFQLMLYPKSRHGVSDPALVRHLRQLMLTYTLDHLSADPP